MNLWVTCCFNDESAYKECLTNPSSRSTNNENMWITFLNIAILIL